ncbi:DUF6323 family protein [Oscillospiraceae bacterium LTW-04]|nr:DUF6323 family protein [Oscillospiraceae bacterium MB24-C1]
MDNQHALSLVTMQKSQAMAELRDSNHLAGRYGLSLSETQITNLVAQRFEVLQSTGRIEFGVGVLSKLVEAFCDSVYITQENYEESIATLQELFYFYKNESLDTFSDDELIEFMRSNFDGPCQGSLDYLGDTSLEALCRNARYAKNGIIGSYEEDDEGIDEDDWDEEY